MQIFVNLTLLCINKTKEWANNWADWWGSAWLWSGWIGVGGRKCNNARAVRLCESQACGCRTVVWESRLYVGDGCVRVRLVGAGRLCESHGWTWGTVEWESGLCVWDGCVRVRLVRGVRLCKRHTRACGTVSCYILCERDRPLLLQYAETKDWLSKWKLNFACVCSRERRYYACQTWLRLRRRVTDRIRHWLYENVREQHENSEWESCSSNKEAIRLKKKA
jgi:hypothetical protein